MRILIYGINYAPELTGIGKYTGEMCSFLAEQGHTVHVVTAMPYYPTWTKHQDYRSKLWHKEIADGVTIYRCPLYVPKKVTPLKRIVHEFSFVVSTFPVWTNRLFAKKYDAIVSVSPPFHLGFLPILYSFLRKTPVVTHIQDLQVDAARDMGMIKNKKVLDLFFRAERFVLRKCNAVTTVSFGMMNKLRAKGIELSKCTMLPNWVDDKVVKPVKKEDSLRKLFGIGTEKKVVLYSGNLGEKQGLENIVEAAKSFRDNKDVAFVIVGAGTGKLRLEAEVSKSGLTNVSFHPLQAYNKLSALLAIADVHLVLQKKSVQDLMMPSKLSSILAAGGVPIVTASRSCSVYGLIVDNKMGIVIEPENVDALVQGIQRALSSDLSELSRNARNYAEVFLSRHSIMNAWERALYSVQLNSNVYRGFKDPEIYSPEKQQRMPWLRA